jgi:hypothetical protein
VFDVCWSIFVFTTLDEDDGNDTAVLSKLIVNLKNQIDEAPMVCHQY